MRDLEMAELAEDEFAWASCCAVMSEVWNICGFVFAGGAGLGRVHEGIVFGVRGGRVAVSGVVGAVPMVFPFGR